MRLFRRGVGSLTSLAPGTDVSGDLLSFDLLSVLESRPDRDAILDRIMWSMPIGERSIRLTMADRYPVVDDTLATMIGERPFTGPLRIRDVGASNAITSVDLFRRLQHLPQLTVEASDRYTALIVVHLAGWRLLFDEDNNWLQLVHGDLVLNRRYRHGDRYPINYALGWLLAPLLVPFARPRLSLGMRIPLFHHKARALAASDVRFTLARLDLFALPAASCEIVRAMTVVHTFSKASRHEAVRALGRSLAEGGLLVLAHGGGPFRLRCSIYRREKGRLVWQRDVGKGDPNRPLVEQVDLELQDTRE